MASLGQQKNPSDQGTPLPQRQAIVGPPIAKTVSPSSGNAEKRERHCPRFYRPTSEQEPFQVTDNFANQLI